MGFFHASTLTAPKPSASLIPQCAACGLYKGCRTPKMVPYGQGRRKILVVGEAPGENEDLQGRPFVGKAGGTLRSALRKLDVDLDRDCWTTNALICRPPGNEIKDPRAIEYCRPNLLRTIKELQPEVIVLLGLRPVQSLLGHLWKEDIGPMGRWVGWPIPSQELNAWVCPTWHPSYIMRLENARESGVAYLLWQQHLEAAFRLQGRPWKQVPDYRSQIDIVLDPSQAAKGLRALASLGEMVALDYETTCLKPDGKDADIWCCSVSNGRQTFAYPWYGEAIQATGELLQSGVPLVASNMKFECRWSLKHFGFMGKGWAKGWDTMLAAHVLDNRPGVTSIKFQSFVLLGQPSYDGPIKPYLQSKKPGCNEPNRIKEVDLNQTLRYCGLDSLLEYKVARIQMKRMGTDRVRIT